MDTNGAIELLWNIAVTIIVLSVSCVVAYAWGIKEGFKLGREIGKQQMAQIMHDTLHELKEVGCERRDNTAEWRKSSQHKDKRCHSKR